MRNDIQHGNNPCCPAIKCNLRMTKSAEIRSVGNATNKHSTPIAFWRCPVNESGISETVLLLNSNDIGSSKWLAHFDWNCERQLARLALSRCDLESITRNTIDRLSSCDIAAFKWNRPKLIAESFPLSMIRSGQLRSWATSTIWYATPSGRNLYVQHQN